MPRITIIGDGEPRMCEVLDGSTLFEAGAKLSAGIETACVGKGTCGLCRVKIVAGAEHLNPYTDEEKKHLGNVYHITKIRLSCRCKPTGDVTIQIMRRPRSRT